MFSRIRISILLALSLSLIFAIPVYAGGLAVITLDELPADVAANEPITVCFSVLQHGRTPITDLEPTITATLSKSESFVVHAKPDGKPGHYTATLTFPKAGEWQWSIQAFSMDQPMPMLTVAASVPVSANQPVANSEPAASTIPWLWIVRALAVGGALAGVVLTIRRRSRWAVALTVLCLTLGAGSFMTGSPVSEVEAQSVPVSKSVGNESASQVELGRQLFVAKGCITCHHNSKVKNASRYWTIEVEGATNLSRFSASPDVLRLRLKDPTLVKSDTQMPNLNLSEAEIEALIAFINSK